ncbi:MAG: JDVT-CTERM system glutamic-type intramembrane protease [Gammaproteobacteria bacterium]|nr:JDVT-CTERM system glutamic-type intramembrane protease [Gammaproteobacteria bacterium]MDH4253154.1 JDVT-CTERM system glutamic-type intramembrane protease [Gammaproteobacteria bacterium]MDH5308484.1 JDVT-CTERM system glutamic-type intramembrane protease [Gammaproteobacteria bacterium]
MTNLAARNWRDLAGDAGLKLPVSAPRSSTFGLVWLAGSLIAFVIGSQTGEPAGIRPALFLSLVLVQPVLEELLFRGAVQGYLRQTSLGGWAWHELSVANVLTSFLFAAAHLVYQPPIWAAGVLLPSLVFGFFRDRTGSVISPVVLHVSFNGMFFLGRLLIH